MLYCPLPWIFQAIRNNGDVRVCCQANQGPDKGLIRKDDGNIYNAAHDDLIECRNAKKMKDIRVAMLNNKWHPDCVRCQQEENSGMRSRLTYESELWNQYFTETDAINLTQPDGTINTKEIPLIYYDLRFGNKCNLKCRTCGPTDSDFWYEDQTKVWGNEYDDTHGKMKIINKDGKFIVENNIYEWYKNKTFWEHMYKEIPNIKHVHMVGGEPLLIQEQFNFLEKCIELGYSKYMSIEHNSNITYIPSRALDLWKHFKTIKIGASIDGIGKINDYIRYPSKWNKVLTNLKKLDNSNINLQLWIAHTVNALNIYTLPDFLKWIIDQDFKNVGSKWQPIASLHPLHSPHFLNVKMFPIEVKQKIKLKFDNFKFDKYKKEAIKFLKYYVHFMMSEDNSESFSKFFYYNNKLDEIRNQKLEDYIPDLYNLIKGY